MNKQSLTENIEALLDQLDSQADITEATQLLHKRFFEKALNAELDQHLGYEKNQARKGSNTRNGTSTKTLHTEEGKLPIDTPRDMNEDKVKHCFTRVQDKGCERVR